MRDYLYALIRYVPDMDRMEPINVGVLLQGTDRLDYRWSPHAAKRGDVDTAVFRQWKDFFEAEVKKAHTPLFQPPRTSPQFLAHLGNLCGGPILLSGPLLLSSREDRNFEELLDDLLARLVLPPDLDEQVGQSRATGRFRQLAKERKFLQRGMKSYAPVSVDSNRRWNAYRQVSNGSLLVVDKIEVGRELGRTANELDKLAWVCELLQPFLSPVSNAKSKRYVLLADELLTPFSDQPKDDFDAMKSELESVTRTIEARGGVVLRSADQAEGFADEVDHMLPP